MSMAPFNWDDYLSLAERLAQSQQDEAALRSAISRAYYAAYCKARNHLRQLGVNMSGVSHIGLWAEFRQSRDRERRALGINGDRLRRVRNRADYDDTFPELAVDVPVSLARARQIVDTL